MQRYTDAKTQQLKPLNSSTSAATHSAEILPQLRGMSTDTKDITSNEYTYDSTEFTPHNA